MHILGTADVYPNAARDDLEPSLSKQNLVKELVEKFKDLNRRADLSRDILKTERRMQGIVAILQALESREAEADQDPLELYRESMNFVDELERTERGLLRLRRGRYAVKPTTKQSERLKVLSDALSHANKKTKAIVRTTKKRTEGTQRRPSRPFIRNSSSCSIDCNGQGVGSGNVETFTYAHLGKRKSETLKGKQSPFGCTGCRGP